MTQHKYRLLRGLYAITDQHLCGDQLLPMAERALQGGTRLLQYRDKSTDHGRRLHQAVALQTLCHQHGGLLIINDDVELALACGADGVHLGREDGAIAAARQRLGAEAIIGCSCYNEPELARQAQQQGADYIAFGRFFPSRTKPNAVQADPQLLGWAKRELGLPTVAIGGITPENGAQLLAQGVDMLAVIEAVFAAPDIRRACQTFSALFESEEARP